MAIIKPADYGLNECWVFDDTPGNVQVAITAANGREAYALLDDEGKWCLSDEGEVNASPKTQDAFANANWAEAAAAVYNR